MKRETEPFSPRREDRDLVDRIAMQVGATNPPDWFSYYAENHSDRISFDVELVSRYFSQATRLVEFGPTPLLLTGALREGGYRVTGVDVGPERFAAAVDSLGIEVVKCDIELEELPFGDATFGGAIFNEIFEHLRIDLIHTFSEVRRVLAPGAILLLSTPNGRSLANVRELLLHDRGLWCGVYESFDALRTTGHMGHVREYTKTDVVEFLTRAGFQCEKVIYRGRYSTNVEQAIVRMLPLLRPHFSIVARRL